MEYEMAVDMRITHKLKGIKCYFVVGGGGAAEKTLRNNSLKINTVCAKQRGFLIESPVIIYPLVATFLSCWQGADVFGPGLDA